MYQARRPSRSEFVTLRHQNYHLRTWGPPAAGQTPLLMLHGWMDVSASFQFVVDALTDERLVVAPDWRGYGQTSGPATDNYWFPDHLADVDFVLDHLQAQTGRAQVDLLGHSMGGNVAMLYAGVRPERVRRLVNLEGFGMPATQPAEAPARYARWIDELKALARGELALRPYADAAAVARRLMRTNPRLTQDQADWLAPHWAEPVAPQAWRLRADDAHKIVNAQLYRVEEVLAIFAQIRAPVLAIEASDNQLASWWQGRYTLAEYHDRLRSVPTLRKAVVENAGHMLHHDQPQALARLIEDFLRD